MELVFLFVMIIAFVVGLNILAIVSLKKRGKKSTWEEEVLTEGKKRYFYYECLKNNINEIKTEAEKQKAILIAERIGDIDCSNILEYFEQSKNLVESENAEELLNKTKSEEASLFKNLTQFVELIGREKRIAMLNAKKNSYLSEIDKLNQMHKTILNGGLATQTREKDWAIAGGIASGIAGGAVGVAVASDIQSQNAEIRATNKANMNAYISSTMGATSKIFSDVSSFEKQIKVLEEDIEAAKIKLVATTEESDIFKNIIFKDTNVSISQTGSFVVETSVSCPNISIFDNIPAVIDGTIQATLYQNDVAVGVALLSLPEYGINNVSQNIKGICLNSANSDLPYTIKFSPYHLWEMEK